MDVSKYCGIVFLKVDNVRNGPIMAAIESVDKARFGKPDLNCSDGTCLELNKTNARVLANAYGTDSDDLINKQIKLKPGTIFYQSTPREVASLHEGHVMAFLSVCHAFRGC